MLECRNIVKMSELLMSFILIWFLLSFLHYLFLSSFLVIGSQIVEQYPIDLWKRLKIILLETDFVLCIWKKNLYIQPNHVACFHICLSYLGLRRNSKEFSQLLSDLEFKCILFKSNNRILFFYFIFELAPVCCESKWSFSIILLYIHQGGMV